MTSSTKAEAQSANRAVFVFPIVILIAGLIGMFAPDLTLPLNPWVVPMLGIVMFLMGLTLTPPDLAAVAAMPRAVVIGCIAQFAIMPVTGWLVAMLMGLDPVLTVGMILLGSAPGGASSNIVAYLARGNVALSISMTSVSTLLAPIMTPLLIWALAGQYLPVDFWSMFKQVLQMVLVPVLLGMIARYLLRGVISQILPVVPWLAMIVLSVLIAGIMSKTGATVLQSGLAVFAAVLIHNAFGFALGYVAAKVTGLAEPERRAISIEVGMQNAGLAAALATANYSPAAALPAAVATIWHNIAGAILAFIFTRRDAPTQRSGEP